MKAERVLYQKLIDEAGNILEMVIWKVAPNARTPEGVRYRLAYIPYGTQEPMVLYDNHHPKGHHRHIQGAESPYPCTSVDRLLEDFQADVAHLQEGHEGWRRP